MLRVALEAVPVVLFLLATFSLLSLLLMLPIAMFAPAKFTKPWKAVSVLSIITFGCAAGWLLLGLVLGFADWLFH